VKGLLYSAGIPAKRLMKEHLFRQGECRRWTLLGSCPCRGQQRHTTLPEERLRNIHEVLKEGMAKYIEFARIRTARNA